jgi:hypothetical protein
MIIHLKGCKCCSYFLGSSFFRVPKWGRFEFQSYLGKIRCQGGKLGPIRGESMNLFACATISVRGLGLWAPAPTFFRDSKAAEDYMFPQNCFETQKSTTWDLKISFSLLSLFSLFMLFFSTSFHKTHSHIKSLCSSCEYSDSQSIWV